MRLILLFILGHFIMSAAVAETLSGPIKVLDAASLRIGQTVVTLNTIAAPQPDDRCPLRSVTIRCCRIAITALMDLTAGARVKCKTHGKPNAKGVYVATCKANGYDLSEGMIYTGWAAPAKAPQRNTARLRPARRNTAGACGGANSRCGQRGCG